MPAIVRSTPSFWHRFDQDTVSRDGSKSGPINHAQSASENAQAGASLFVMSVLAPVFGLIGRSPMGTAKTVGEYFTALGTGIGLGVYSLFAGAKDLFVDAPAHGVAALFEKK